MFLGLHLLWSAVAVVVGSLIGLTLAGFLAAHLVIQADAMNLLVHAVSIPA